MPNYANGKVYTIRSHQTPLVYVGSTTIGLQQRLAEHRSKFKNGKLTCSSIEIIKYDDAYIELLEEFKCENRTQLNAREGHYIRQLDCVNKRIEGRTPREWRDDNKEAIAKHKKAYREDNKEKLAERKKDYYCDNREKILEYKKQYRETHREQIKQYKTQNQECPCGGKYQITSKARHLRSKRHIAYAEQL